MHFFIYYFFFLVIPTIQPLHHSLLKGHKNYITDIKWSHHSDSSILASTSEDNLAIVMNKKNKNKNKQYIILIKYIMA